MSESSESSSPPSASQSPARDGPVVPLAGLAAICAAWFTGRIPDWRYALAAIVVTAGRMPLDAVVALATKLLQPKR